MKRLLFLLGLLVSVYASAQIDQVVPKKPPVSEGLVHDYAGILTIDQKQSLNRKLIAYDDSTSNQIAVVTLPTLKDRSGNAYEDEEVALEILRNWGLGQKDRNNGIVILIVKSKDDKERKIRIEVGYGLEGRIPDVAASTIINHRLTTRFREGNYYRGLDEATDDIFKAAAGEYKAPAGYNKKKGSGFKGIGTIFLVIIIIIIFIAGRRGGGSGGMASRRGFGDIGTAWLLGTLLSGGRGGGGGWSGGGGGWSGGGGGFGGFGGGSGGGGGASGSW